MTVETIILAIAIPIGIAALTAWINIKIKFAPDAAHASREAKSIFFKLFLVITHLYLAGLLIWVIVSPKPWNRADYIVVILNSLVLFHSYMMWWVGQIVGVLRGLSNTDEAFVDLFKASIGGHKRPK